MSPVTNPPALRPGATQTGPHLGHSREPCVEGEEFEPLPERPAAVVLLLSVTAGRYRFGHVRGYSRPVNAPSILCLVYGALDVGYAGDDRYPWSAPVGNTHNRRFFAVLRLGRSNPPAMPCGPPSCRPTERKPEMPTKPTRPHSVVVVKLPQSETVVVVCEDGSAAYLKWEDQTWGRLRPVPLTEADLAGTEPTPT
jgi:hypothetical protein